MFVSAAAACATAIGIMPAPSASASVVDIGESEYQIAFEKTGAKMTPWSGSTERTAIRVWPDDRAGMEWAVSRIGVNLGHTTYEIRNLRSDLCLQPMYGVTESGRRIEQAPCDERRTQRWHVEHVGGPAFQIIPLNNTYLAITPESPTATKSFLKLDYRNPIDPDYRWDFRPTIQPV
ncbi:hypothetical protein CDO52_22190 [Nocardiopsis gilva YIM 90087]|uniref:Ricin B lectin domain-containing protein n=2 Tax=Nocardiopsis gilva TaxID=280236 RepID=A0A223SE04_9ACTN|nr:hypothetical protein CDO52_22190 [Nocardiopsis gilva YIM 90087]